MKDCFKNAVILFYYIAYVLFFEINLLALYHHDLFETFHII